jgi:quinol-cytochrome oxidoreductase complex cytochrome b subunit
LPSTSQAGFSGAITQASDWLKTRFANIDIFDEHYQNEAKTNPFYALGPIFYLVWFIVMATGLVLIMWYIPSKANAFDSILRIQHEIPFGGLMRGMHKYGADAMIIAATMRMFRMFICADYKPGKEFNIAIGLITLLLCLYSGLTGYLLIWNQRAFWATKVFATFPTYMDQFPVMGDFYQPLIKSLHLGWNTAEFLLGAGGAITQETITRFFSIHLAFSLIPLIFVELYFYKTGFPRMPIGWVKRSIVTLMLVVTAVILPAAIGARSNPDVTPLPILSDWYFLGLYQMYKYLEPVVATEITIVIPLTVIALPFLDVAITGPEKDWRKRPFMFMVTLMGFFNWVIFSFLIIFNIANIHNDPPYWRDFLWLMGDIGIIWQLALIWKLTDLKERAKQFTGAVVMGVLALIQSLCALAYYFMAKTEMALDPLLHQFAYQLVRWAIPDAGRLEELTRKVCPTAQYTSLPYNMDFQDIVKEMFIPKGGPEVQQAMTQLQQAAQQPTPLDWLVAWIPTFTPQTHPHYLSLTDFMITNRWMHDYCLFVDRMDPNLALQSANIVQGTQLTYPLPMTLMVQGEWTVLLDWGWMVGGFVTMVLAFGTAYWCRTARQPQPQPTKAVPEAA